MAADEESLLHSLRGLLNQDSVKLWLEPYTTKEGERGEVPVDLINKYSAKLGTSAEVIGAMLEKLRCHALEKLKARKKLKESGELTLKVKLSGQQGSDFVLKTTLSCSGRELKELISAQSGVSVDLLKLICQGKILDDSSSLNDHRVKLNSQVLAVCLVATEKAARERDIELRELERIRQAAEILADKCDDRGGTEDEYYLQVADQSGKPLTLPKEERRALALAMTLHEKGRAFSKRKNYNLALLLFIEADEKFTQCRSSILEAVDNYALLCLDIVWTYLCLQNLDNLPDASQRLNKCQECFSRSYGPQMSRVASVKGTSGNESALFVRLHLLQAVVAYHQHQNEHARLLLAQTQSEIQALAVDDDQIMQIVSLGFTPREARIGLRACQGIIDAAVNHIIRHREEKENLRKNEKEERKNRALARTLGKTVNGNWVNTELYRSMIQMGFSGAAATEALKRSDNDIGEALQILQNEPEVLNLVDRGPQELTDEQIGQIMSMGFEPERVREMIRGFCGSIEEAMEALINGDLSPGTSSSDSESGNEKKSKEEKKREKEAMDTIVKDLPEEDNEYLDLTFDEEARYVEHYSNLLSLLE